MDNENELEVLLKEYDGISTQINSLMSSTDKIIGLGFTILAAGLTLGLKEGIIEVLLFVPVATLFMLFYAVSIYSTVFSLGGYKSHIENTINNIIGKNVLVRETLVYETVHKKLPIIILYVLYVVFLASTVYLAVSGAGKLLTDFGITMYSLFVCILFILLILSFIQMLQAPAKAYHIAQTAYERPLADSSQATLSDRGKYLTTAEKSIQEETSSHSAKPS